MLLNTPLSPSDGGLSPLESKKANTGKEIKKSIIDAVSFFESPPTNITIVLS